MQQSRRARRLVSSLLGAFLISSPKCTRAVVSATGQSGLSAMAAAAAAADTFEAGLDRPNVLVVVIDDMGWKDVGFHDPSFSTPNLDLMAAEGVELSTFYTAPACTPSRAQLMTGRYNFRTGMQDSVLHSTEPRGVPLTETFLGEKLQTAGYNTAMVGKWHLGMHMPQYLPLARGFDQYYGILTGGGGHYSHMSVSQEFTPRGDKSQTRVFNGPNMVEGNELSPDSHGPVHSTELYSGKAAQYVSDLSEQEEPWFLYLAYQAIHDPMETDDTWINGRSCEAISEESAKSSGTAGGDTDWDNRRIACGMVAQVDHGLGELRTVLEDLGEWENTVVVFFSDNGGLAAHGSVNHPFRGGKGDYWEGGVHVPAFISGGFVRAALAHNNIEPYRYGHLTHVTDIHATMLALAGYADGGSIALDGFDLWRSLVATQSPVRETVVLNLNSVNFARSGAVRWGKYKLIRNPEPNETAIFTRVRVKLANEGLAVSETVLQEATAAVHAQLHLSEPKMYLFDLEANPSESISEDCGVSEGNQSKTPITACANLYNIPHFRKIQQKLEGLLKHAEVESVLPTLRWMDDGPLADPLNFGGWVPWRDGRGDPLANYEGLAYEEPGQGSSDGSSKGNGGERGPEAVEAMSLAEAVDGTTADQLAAGSVYYYEFSASAATGFAFGVAILAGAATFLGYRAGQRSGYHTLGKH